MELEAFHCPRWEELPQLALYMDQVLLVLSTAFAPLSAGQPPVTASMSSSSSPPRRRRKSTIGSTLPGL